MDETKGADLTLTDQEILLQAVHEVRVILGAYIEPGECDPERALNSILGVIDRDDVIAAVERLDRRKAIQLVTILAE